MLGNYDDTAPDSFPFNFFFGSLDFTNNQQIANLTSRSIRAIFVRILMYHWAQGGLLEFLKFSQEYYNFRNLFLDGVS
jgi:hypothetical protein